MWPKLWAFKTGGVIAASPTVVGNTVYVGSWDGYEYAIDATTGQQKWKTNVGQSYYPNCGSFQQHMGITAAAPVQNNIVYIAGGDAYFYALDASSGAVLWKVFLGDPAKGYYNFSSPLLYNGDIYYGTASNCDNPLVQGQLFQISLASHMITHTFNVVPNGQTGGAIWTSPSVDPSTNTILITTGNGGGYSFSVVALDATTFAVKGSWKVPSAQQVTDSDWGTTPTVFTTTSGIHMITANNKNGTVYVFRSDNLQAGPVWQKTIAVGGECPECGQGSIASSAFANNTLYVGGGNTTVHGTSYKGAVRAFDPTTGNALWEHGASGPIVSALAYANNLIVDGVGSTIEVLNASNGTVLYHFQTGGVIYGAPSIANGKIFAGSVDTNVYAFGLAGAQPQPTSPPVSPLTPTLFCLGSCPTLTPFPLISATIPPGRGQPTTSQQPITQPSSSPLRPCAQSIQTVTGSNRRSRHHRSRHQQGLFTEITNLLLHIIQLLLTILSEILHLSVQNPPTPTPPPVSPTLSPCPSSGPTGESTITPKAPTLLPTPVLTHGATQQPHLTPSPLSVGSNFAQVCGTQICINGKPFHIHGATAYGQYSNAANEMALAKQGNINTLEIVEFENNYHNLSDMMSSGTWAKVDNFIAQAQKNGIYVILHLASYGQSLQVAGKDYTNATLWQPFFDFIANRTNTVTGVKYVNDPTILMIELFGEIPQNTNDASFFHNALGYLWTKDQNHIISAGGLSYINYSSGIDWKTIMSDPNNQVCGMEINSSGDRNISVPNVSSLCKQLGKPWFLAAWSSCYKAGGGDLTNEPDIPHMTTHAQDMYNVEKGAAPATMPTIGSDFWNLANSAPHPGTCDLSPQFSTVWSVVQNN